MRLVLLTLLLCVLTLPAWAINPDEALNDPALEARARSITREVRCLVCQGESVDESNAQLAADLRAVVRQRLQVGDTDAQVKAYLVSRYGEYVLLRPPFGAHTFVLWCVPFVMLAGAAYVIVRVRNAAVTDGMGPS